jgi:hypothetical protein
MYISVRNNLNEDVKLFLQPKDEAGESNTYILVEEFNNDPCFELKLENNTFKIININNDIAENKESLQDKLDALSIEVIEALQQGRDLTEKNTTESHNPYDPNLIRVETKNFSLRQIHDMITQGDINLSPDFQRHLVWDTFRKSRLIESILLRIPLPMFYFSQDEEGILSVVDGLQRLNAIKEYMENIYSLRDLEYLKDCESKFYSTKEKRLDDKFFRWFNMTQITVNIIDPQSPYKVKYDIFRRINTGGKPLNAQELRNCLAHNNLRRLLKEMAEHPSFLTATGKSISDVRMDAQEFALRFIYFHKLLSNGDLIKYTGTIDTELDSLVESIGATPYEELCIYLELYVTAMTNSHYLFGKHAFRKVTINSNTSSPRSQINKALFVSLSVLLSAYAPDDIKKDYNEHSLVKPLGVEINNSMLNNYLSYGTNGRANIIYTFESVANIICNNTII